LPEKKDLKSLVDTTVWVDYLNDIPAPEMGGRSGRRSIA
jgi:hypothetical protein